MRPPGQRAQGPEVSRRRRPGVHARASAGGHPGRVPPSADVRTHVPQSSATCALDTPGRGEAYFDNHRRWGQRFDVWGQ